MFCFSYWYVSFAGESIYNCCQTPGVPLCLPSRLPSFYPQPGVRLDGNAAYNGLRVNHLQVSPDKSQYVCCAASKSQQQLWGCAESGLWHSECWPTWEAVCWGAYLNTTIWNASVALKALVCVSNGHSSNAKNRAKFTGCTNGLTSVEFAHNLGLMCDVLSELKDLSKQSGGKREGKKEKWRKRRRKKRSKGLEKK